MYFINPFKGLRPTKENASSVSVASTDHLSEDVRKDHLKKNPWSYLNVFNAENNKKSREQFELMKEESIIRKDEKLSFYFYKISKENFKQVGIVGTAKLTAYDNLHIRGHEEIFFERSQKRMKQMDNLNAQIGPIYAVYPDDKKLNDVVEKELVNSPIYSFEGMDGYKHEMWMIDEKDKVKKISDLFNFINRIYIADGHHRMDALLKLSKFKQHQNPNHTGDEAYNFFMIAIFPRSQARILDYNRLIKDLYGYSRQNFIKEIKKKFKVEKKILHSNQKKLKYLECI